MTKQKTYRITVACRGELRLPGDENPTWDFSEGQTITADDAHSEVLARLIAEGIAAETKE